MSKEGTIQLTSVKNDAVGGVQEIILTRVVDELRGYLMAHEGDIAHKINDFGDLYNSFQFVVGRPPSKVDQ